MGRYPKDPLQKVIRLQTTVKPVSFSFLKRFCEDNKIDKSEALNIILSDYEEFLPYIRSKKKNDKKNIIKNSKKQLKGYGQLT